MIRSLAKQGWLQIALGGIILFIIVDLALRSTRSTTFLPAFIVLGAFTIPVTFAAYFFLQEHLLDRTVHGGIPLIQAFLMFLGGGIIGTIIAGVLSSPLVFHSDLANFISVSVIEEIAKLVFPVVVFLQARYRSEVDGLVFGVAAGVGFAALETIGYSLLVLLPIVGGGIGDLQEVLIIRGLLSPLGHAAWTGLICYAIWHYRGQGKKQVLMPLAYFLMAIFLHTLWNFISSRNEALIIFPSYIVIGGFGLSLMLWHLKNARQRSAAIDQYPKTPGPSVNT